MARAQHQKVTVIGSYSSKNTLLYQFSNITHLTQPGEQYEVELYAPENTIAETDLIRMQWDVWTTATGTNDKRLACLANQRKMGITIGYAKDNQFLEYNYGEWQITESRNQPSDKRNQHASQKGVVFTSEDPLVFQFHNLSATIHDNKALKEIFVRYHFERVVQQ